MLGSRFVERDYPALDGIRGLAIILVMSAHFVLSPRYLPLLFPPGVLGVDVFLVLSGFLIASALFKDHARSGKIRFGKFYSRRAARILPALLVFLGSAASLAYLLPELIPVQSVKMAAIGVLTFSLNLQMVSECRYCDPLSSLWSLSLEEQFYFVLPLCMLFLLRAQRLFLWIALLSAPVLLSWAVRYPGCLGEEPLDLCWQMNAAHGTASRFMGQGIGVIVAVLFRFGLIDVDSRNVHVTSIGAVYLAFIYFIAAGISGQITSCVGFDIICLGTGGLIVLSLSSRPNPIQRFLSNRFLRVSGQISYGLYLWHGLALWISAEMLPGPLYFRGLIGILTAYILAFTSFRFLETPILRRVHGILRDRSESK